MEASMPEVTQRFEWIILQSGDLTLRPNGGFDVLRGHFPTVTLIWPEGVRPSSDNMVMVDPYFSDTGFDGAALMLRQIEISFEQIRYIHVTHPHYDHLPRFPDSTLTTHLRPFRPGEHAQWTGLTTVACPGHDPTLRGLRLCDKSAKNVWIVGDAALNEEWLRAWGYYWPNQYTPGDIIQTWRSVAAIIAGADLIVPGHGAPIMVTAALIDDLLESFPVADYAANCPDVAEQLRARRDQLSGA
jgi:glyoxylase-like metal-dependent hydrolase (beta-lactamase superfamily II)